MHTETYLNGSSDTTIVEGTDEDKQELQKEMELLYLEAVKKPGIQSILQQFAPTPQQLLEAKRQVGVKFHRIQKKGR